MLIAGRRFFDKDAARANDDACDVGADVVGADTRLMRLWSASVMSLEDEDVTVDLSETVVEVEPPSFEPADGETGPRETAQTRFC